MSQLHAGNSEPKELAQERQAAGGHKAWFGGIGLYGAAALDIEKKLYLSGVRLAGDIGPRPDDGCLVPSFVDVTQDQVKHSHGSLEHLVLFIPLLERVAARRHDDHTDAAFNEPRRNEIGNGPMLGLFFQPRAAALFPNVAV